MNGYMGEVGLKCALRVSKFNTDQPGAGSNILSTEIDPRNAFSFFHIYVCMSNAGVLTLKKTASSTTVSEDLFGGVSLTAGSSYLFTIAAASGETINLAYSATGGKVRDLKIAEVRGVV